MSFILNKQNLNSFRDFFYKQHNDFQENKNIYDFVFDHLKNVYISENEENNHDDFIAILSNIQLYPYDLLTTYKECKDFLFNYIDEISEIIKNHQSTITLSSDNNFYVTISHNVVVLMIDDIIDYIEYYTNQLNT